MGDGTPRCVAGWAVTPEARALQEARREGFVRALNVASADQEYLARKAAEVYPITETVPREVPVPHWPNLRARYNAANGRLELSDRAVADWSEWISADDVEVIRDLLAHPTEERVV